jgi:hypothetical protein
MDFKWKLSRPGIELEFETGSIAEAIGLLEEEGTQISTVFGFTMGNAQSTAEQPSGAVEPAAEPAKRGRGKAKPVEAVAPDPLPVPAAAAPPAPTVTTLPPNALPTAAPAPAEDNGIPPFLQRVALPPLLPSPPTAPVAAPTPPPVGVLGPKVVAALELHKLGKEDGGQALADWLHACNLTQKGATYDAACRVVLMTSDEKLAGIAGQLGVPV